MDILLFIYFFFTGRGDDGQFKRGSMIFACKSMSPILPAAHNQSWSLMPEGSRQGKKLVRGQSAYGFRGVFTENTDVGPTSRSTVASLVIENVGTVNGRVVRCFFNR